MKDIIAAVKAHAKANYNKGGWDIVVEAYEDSEIAEAIEGCSTAEQAIAKMGKIVGVRAAYREDIQAERF